MPLLNGKEVSVINSRLRPTPERNDPHKLEARGSSSFKGSMIYGMGFVLSPEERVELIARNRRSDDHIFPYLGGAEVNSNPDQGFDRYVINFGSRSLKEAEQWPNLLDIVRAKVKPERDKLKRKALRDRWWQFGEKQTALYAALEGKRRCLVTARVTKHLCFSFQPTDRVLNEKLYVFPLESYSHFGLLQSRVHERWTRLLSSTLKTDLSYSATDCFETFPFPQSATLAGDAPLCRIAETLYARRAALMLERQQGLTTTYNQLKDPEHQGDADIDTLRALHVDLDRVVLAAYGWSDIYVPSFTCHSGEEFERFENEVIDRLFTLNAERSKSPLIHTST